MNENSSPVTPQRANGRPINAVSGKKRNAEAATLDDALLCASPGAQPRSPGTTDLIHYERTRAQDEASNPPHFESDSSSARRESGFSGGDDEASSVQRDSVDGVALTEEFSTPLVGKHGHYWWTRYRAVLNADNWSKLANELKVTPHMKDVVVPEPPPLIEERATIDDVPLPGSPVNESFDEDALLTADNLSSEDKVIYDCLPNEDMKNHYLRGKLREMRQRKVAEQKAEIAEHQRKIAEHQRKVAEQKAERELHQRKVAERKAELGMHQRKIEKRLVEITVVANSVETSLLALSSLSQAEGTVARDTKDAEETLKKRGIKQSQAEEFVKDADPIVQEPASLSETYNSILENEREFSSTFDRESLKRFDDKKQNPLLRLSNAYAAAVKSTTNFTKRQESHGDLEGYKMRIEKTVNKLQTEFKKARENCEHDPSFEADLVFPGPTSQEVHGVQPVFKALLEAIGDCCQVAYDGKTHPSSPPIIGVSEQKELYGNEKRRGRRCDITVWKRGRHVVVLLDGFMEVTFEIKPGQRIDKTVLDMLREGKDQDLSHVAKALLHCLRFADGAGVPSHATSITGSLSHIEIIQLCVVDPGKPTSRVELRSSGPLPLLPKDCFCKWFDSDNSRHSEAVDTMANLLYGKDDNGLDEKGIPLGIKALYTMMMCPRRELIGPNWEKVSGSLGELLGTGTFGMVFAVNGSDDAVVKLAKPSLSRYIKREAVILKLLSSCDDRPNSVGLPHFIACGLMEVNVGGVAFQLPALAMQPRCQNIYSVCSGWSDEKRFSVLKKIHNGILSALGFIHKQHNICHRDVNDANILLRYHPETDEWSAVLVDFSVAGPMYENVKGFVGTPTFTHREVHKNSEWISAPQYDDTNLGFTLIVILEGGVVPWKGLSDKGPQKGTDVYDKRIEQANLCLQENVQNKKLDADLAKCIKDLFLKDKEKFRSACGCKKTQCRGGRCSCSNTENGCSILCACCYDKQKAAFSCLGKHNGPQKGSVDDVKFDAPIGRITAADQQI